MPLDYSSKPVFDLKTSRSKIEYYCSYQERSQQEVRDKLYTYGLHKADVENLICELIQDNFLNEERFASAYASGKFRIKGWGKNKIRYALKQKSVPPKLIEKALNLIDDDEYLKSLENLLQKQKESRSMSMLDQQKVIQFAIYKGFEFDIIKNVLNSL